MKPYAYAVVQGEDDRENVSLQFDHPEMCGQTYRQAIPLFTHPVKELTLSIVDIDTLIDQFWYSDDAGFHFHYYDFVEGILRKAQEK